MTTSEEYVKELCDERHEFIKEKLIGIEGNIKQLFTKLNWFYVLAIGTLFTTLGAVIVEAFRG